MILIIEGSNRVGKSTFIKRFKEKGIQAGFNVVIYNKRYARDNYDYKYNEEERANERMLAETNLITSIDGQLKNTIFIFDRFHLSELAYGERFRDYKNYFMYDIDKILGEHKSLLILLLSDYEHLDCSNEKKKELFEIQDKMQEYFAEFKYERKIKLSLQRLEILDVLVDNVIARIRLMNS